MTEGLRYIYRSFVLFRQPCSSTRNLLNYRTAVGCNANIRIYRYGVGQRFGKHVDESVEDEHGNLSQWTVLIYLNGGSPGSLAGAGASEAGAHVGDEPLRGGETVFYKVGGRPVAGIEA